MRDYLSLSARVQRRVHSNLVVLILCILLPYLFLALGTNVFQIPLAPGDGIVQGLPQEISSSKLQLWNPFVQAGTFPFKDGTQHSYLPAIIVMRIFPNAFGYNLLLLLHYSLAGFATFLFLKELRLNQMASFLGGLVFMFCGFLTAHLGHHTMIMAAAYLPIVLYFIERFISSKKIVNLCLAALAFGLSILADYMAVGMYIGMVSFPYIIFRVLSGPEWDGKPLLRKIFAITAIAAVTYLVGLALAAVEVIPVLESLKYVTRQQISFGFFASFSFPIKLLPLLLFPFIYGTQSLSLYLTPYFGPWNLTEMSGYMGMLPMLFAILAFLLFRKKNRQVYFWTAVALIAFVLVLGDSTPIYKLLYRVPIYNMFRGSARNWLEVNFAVAVLSAFFVHYIMAADQVQEKGYYKRVFFIALALILAAFLILGPGGMLIPSPDIRGLWSGNAQFTSSAVYIPLIIMLFSIVLLFLLFRYKASNVFWMLVTTSIFLDLFFFGHFINGGYTSFEVLQGRPNPLATFLNGENADKGQYRILTLDQTNFEDELYPCINLLYGINVINAYSPIWLKDYRDLTTFETSGVTPQKYGLLHNSTILSLLSTKYIVTADPVDKSFLQTLLIDTRPQSNKMIVDGLGDAAWSFSSADHTTDGAVVLQSPAPSQLSLIQIPFAIQPRTSYAIAFKAARVGASPPGDVLVFDFFGENYHVARQAADVDASQAANQFYQFNVLVYSGENTPGVAYLRFYTLSNTPYEVKDVTLVQDVGEVPYWGSEQVAVGAAPLYAKKSESPAGIAIYENLNFLPRARFVENVRVENDSAAAIRTLWNDREFNPSTSAIVENYSGDTRFESGEVISADYSKGSSVTLSVKTGRRAFLVLSDTWYPGWKAFVDDKQTPIYKTNAVSRGILIEGDGEHKIEFRFVPMSFYLGLTITCLTFMVMAVCVLLDERRVFDKQALVS